jgi:hypothetical protein
MGGGGGSAQISVKIYFFSLFSNNSKECFFWAFTMVLKKYHLRSFFDQVILHYLLEAKCGSGLRGILIKNTNNLPNEWPKRKAAPENSAAICGFTLEL